MKSFLITKERETLVGLRLSGIQGEIIKDSHKILEKIDALIKDESIGIILITQSIFTDMQEEIIKRKLEATETLIISIPAFGETLNRNLITNHIKESIGLDFE